MKNAYAEWGIFLQLPANFSDSSMIPGAYMGRIEGNAFPVTLAGETIDFGVLWASARNRLVIYVI